MRIIDDPFAGDFRRVRRASILPDMVSRGVSILATIGLSISMCIVTTSAAAAAGPSSPTTLTYHLTDCSGPIGTPTTFDAVKQPGGAAALHLVDGSGIFVAMEAIDVESGTILFSTPGFKHNRVPTVTCQSIHPITLTLQSVTGIILPFR